MKKLKTFKAIIPLAIVLIFVFLVQECQKNKIEENKINNHNYKQHIYKYMYKLEFSKTEKPTEEEMENYKQYMILSSEGAGAKNQMEYEKAIDCYTKASVYNKKAYYELGNIYLEMGNKEKAIENYKIAYEKGYFDAAFNIGKIYSDENDVKKSLEWYAKGAEKHSDNSQLELGKRAYYYGNIEEAKKWFEKAINNFESAVPMYYLMAISYKKNDIKELKKWHNKMKEIGIEDIFEENLEKIKYMTGNEKERKIFELLDEAEAFIYKKQYLEAEKIYLDAIKYDKKSSYHLGYLYEHYIKNEQKAIEKYEEAFKNGNLKGAYYLAGLYWEKQDDEKAIKWYKTAADKGDVDAQASIVMIISNNLGKEESFNYAMKAAKQKHILGITSLVEYYRDKKNYSEMKKWIYKAMNDREILYLTTETKLFLLMLLDEIEKRQGYSE